MNIVTAAEMAECDRRTVSEFGISMQELMEAAGGAVAAFCLRRYATARSVVLLCGKGNNGGDGLVAARVLAQAGLGVTVALLGGRHEVAAAALERLDSGGVPVKVVEVTDQAAVASFAEVLRGTELIVDAILGTGFKPPLRGVAAAMRDSVAGLKVPVVAVDLPSGWDADSIVERYEGAFRADGVVTFTAPKPAHVFGHLTTGVTGAVVVAEIGSPAGAIVSSLGLRWTGEAKAMLERPRPINSNKGKFGHVLVVGGSYGKAGAPSMTSLAALRAGAGLVTAAVPKSIVNTVARVTPELMVAPLTEGIEGVVSFKNMEAKKLTGLLKKMTVLAVGPGLSTDGDAPAFARQMVEKTLLPVVIDADALNAFEGRASELSGQDRVLVLTPHPGEMSRLTGLSIKEVEIDRLGLARRFAMEHHLTLVLKGWRTLVAHPDGSVAVNTTGNPGMAKGGSGDILTGIVAAMLAQFPEDVAKAVEAAVYLHGLAADFAARVMDEHTILATDTVTHLSDAFRYRVKDEDGLTWIAGMPG